jgi:hypothetical protein
MKRLKILVLALVFIWTHILCAQKQVYFAERANPKPPVIDGVLDDLGWQAAAWQSDFVQYVPLAGAPPAQATAFKVIYDDKNLYVGIRAYDTEPEKIVRRTARRDEGRDNSDLVGIILDSYFDHRTGFEFSVNAAGVRNDIVYPEDGMVEDRTWDPVWYTKTAVDDSGWTAEMRIPFSQLRFSEKDEQVWGFLVFRHIYRLKEEQLWPPLPNVHSGWVHLIGELHGLKGITVQRRVELLPYTLGKMEKQSLEAINPLVQEQSGNFAAGLDGKIAITSDLTLDFTVNPDFGQVEADPSVVNLTSFETFYEEKRPFFIEGKNLYEYPMGLYSTEKLFHSRRIGRTPQYEPDLGEAEHLSIPQNTSIVGAFKLSGKTHSGWSIGLLEAITAEEYCTIESDGYERRQIVEPMTSYFAGRWRKDFNEANTIIGGILTAVNRKIDDSHLNFLPSSAYTGGFEFFHQWKDKTYYVNLKSNFSHVQGASDAIRRVQAASPRYFQRQDAQHLTFDSTRTNLSGYSGFFQVGKGGISNWQYNVSVYWVSPGFESNDIGFIKYADRISQDLNIHYKVRKPMGIFRRYSFRLSQWNILNFGGEQLQMGGLFNGSAQFLNQWGIDVNFTLRDKVLDTFKMRGGPSVKCPSEWRLVYKIYSDPRSRIQFTVDGFINHHDDSITRFYQFSPGITYRMGSTMSFGLQPTYSSNIDNEQYVNTVDVQDGHRYILGRLHQKTLGLVFRFNYSLKPGLSIQYYGQPFISSQKFTHFKRLTDARANNGENRFHTFDETEIGYNDANNDYMIDEDGDGTVDYTVNNPDFHVREFLSNLVVRWEYTPGSVLYLVWSQERAGMLPTGEFAFGNDLRGVYDISPHNVFLVKLNYWFCL